MYVVLTTFYDTELTPVCTTEFIAFAQRYQDFKDRNAELLGLSIDSNSSHIAWIHNIYQNTGIEIPFPVIADRDMAISRLYGMIQPGVSGTETVRNVFCIAPNGIIRAKLIYTLINGRNIGEILRLLDVLQTEDLDMVRPPPQLALRFPDDYPAAANGGGRDETARFGRQLHGLVSVLQPAEETDISCTIGIQICFIS